MKSAIVFLALIAFAAAMPLIVPTLTEEDEQFLMEYLKNIEEQKLNNEEEQFFTVNPIYPGEERSGNNNAPFLVKHPNEIFNRLKDLPLETTTNAEKEQFFTVSPIYPEEQRSGNGNAPFLVKNPNEIFNRLKDLPLETTTKAVRTTTVEKELNEYFTVRPIYTEQESPEEIAERLTRLPLELSKKMNM